MAQIQIKMIDPSVLAIKDKEQVLSLDDVGPTKAINVSKTLVN